MLKTRFIIFLLTISFGGFAQNTIDNYKYVVVPEKFSFQKEVDQYSLNNLTKNLLKDKGLTSYFDNENLPTEIATNRCLALIADLQEKKTMFTTSLTLILKDCKGNILFKGKEGKSREKDFQAAYRDALRNAFVDLIYNYNGGTGFTDHNLVPPVVDKIAPPVQIQAPVTSETVNNAIVDVKSSETMLYAQPISNGYQLINTIPKIVLTIYNTSVPEYFIASRTGATGIVLKKNADWYFEYYQNDKLISEKLSIKF